MHTHTVNSSVIVAITYSPEAALDIEFASGAAYRYFAVPPRVVHDFLSADSKGAFFNRRIRSRFHSERLVR